MIKFIINVNDDDQRQATNLAKQINRHFEQRATVIGNGTTITKELAAVSHTKSFHKATSVGFLTHRYLTLALQTPADTIISLNPLTCIKGKRTIPAAEWFGDEFICGFSRIAAQKLIQSGLLYRNNDLPRVMKRLGVQLLKWSL